MGLDFSQLKNNIDLKKNDKNLFLDIGGGYGGLLRFIKHYYSNSVGILIDLPEVCCFASYYLQSCFPEAKIGLEKDFRNIDKIFLIIIFYIFDPKFIIFNINRINI